ncbi:glycosyltransferase [Bacillus ndiopicus]|uniref:glycosyltransferase n=1 Tax=Bacillus ndiopicus TaxID=1347368 RepID=UPI0005AA725A|nr:glycosyltransferase [Bacillus ndiopicus]
MKIIIIPSWYVTEDNPNSGIFFKEQAHALKKHIPNSHVTVLYVEMQSSIKAFYQLPKIKFTEEENVYTYRYTSPHYFPKLNKFRISYLIQLYKKLYRIYVEKNGVPDVIHAHSALEGGLVALAIAKENDVKVIITEHSSVYVRGNICKWQREIACKVFDEANQVIAVSNAMKREIEKYSKRKIYVIPNIVDLSLFQYTPIRNKNEEFTFFSLAFLNKNKRMDLVINAFDTAFHGKKEVKLKIGGSGSEIIRLKELVYSKKIQTQVTFLGELKRSEVVKEMRECNAFVLASEYETFGVVLIEALATGRPVISTKSGGPEDIINENNGLLVEGNIENLRDAMVKMYKNPIEINPEEVMNNYSSQYIVEQLKKIYEN